MYWAVVPCFADEKCHAVVWSRELLCGGLVWRGVEDRRALS